MMFVLGRVPKKLLGYMVACVGGLAVVGFLLIMTIGKVEEQPDNKKLLTEQVEPKKEEKRRYRIVFKAFRYMEITYQ